MEELVQCPVCTLYLHNGMTLESHLDTHPKDQVIKALCSLSVKPRSYGSRTPTPSDRSYRSRSRTPATEDSVRWSSSHRTDNDRYWRTPSRTPKLSSRSVTPDVRGSELNFEGNSTNNSVSQFSTSFSNKTDKTHAFIPSAPMSESDQSYFYYGDQSDDKEIKYSRSAEYNAVDNSNNVFTYSLPEGRTIKLQGPVVPPSCVKNNDLLKVLPKPNNILYKSNIGGVQYLTPRVKPTHLVVSPAPTFLQKNVQSNLIMTGNSTTPLRSTPQLANQFNPMSSTGTTVVTQNSQFIYREMVHNLDGKPFISNMPTVLTTQENINVAQSSSMYQNVMIVDQFGNSPCMYTTPQQLVPKACSNVYNNSSSIVSTTTKATDAVASEANKTLVIEIGPIVNPPTSTENAKTSIPSQPASSTPKKELLDNKVDTSGTSKGLKILSNIKVEVPVQHHKNMLNTLTDLTGSNDNDYAVRPISPERILPDLDDNNHTMSDDSTQPSVSSGDSLVSHSFSVIKNVGNPPSYKDSSSKSSVVDNKLESEFSDSCPVPDLICNEKPSISPCSELSEACDNSTDNTSISPKPQTSCSKIYDDLESCQIKIKDQRTYRNNALRLNNIYVKKHKKVLQIKNAKSYSSTITSKSESYAKPSSSNRQSPERFSINKTQNEKHAKVCADPILQAVEKIKKIDNDFDADTEEQSMDLEPVAPSSLNGSGEQVPILDSVKVKEEINTSNEGGFSNEAGTSDRAMSAIDGLRPINVISYGNMAAGDFDDESNHRELLDLEAVSKNKQFVNMMNDNYFGDNIYADYFTPDRVESFDAVRDTFPKDGHKEDIYQWGETTQKEAEFVLPNFIHESYKIAESNGIDYSEIGEEEGRVDIEVDGCERDSKADVLSEGRSESEAPLNICADERMPPRGELSGQESNGDMDTPWTGMYTEVTPSEPYDLIARESWVSDGSEIDATEKPDNLDEDLHFPKSRLHTCSQCGAKFSTLKEMRSHKALAHAMATSSGSKTSYSRLVTARTIKKEEKPDESILEGNLLAIDSKEGIASTMLQVYDVMNEAKPKIEGFIKQETKRRRKDHVCPTCKVDQLTEPAFNEHLKIHPLECLTCGKCFFRRANLAIHVKTHLGIKNYKCEVCEKRFMTRQKLSEHHNVHTGRAPVKCTVCDDSFRRYSNMVQHRDRHHYHKKAKIRDYVCHCGSVFHSKAKLLWHKETHEEKPKACLYCSDKFVHASSLTRHVRRSHNKYFMSERYKGKAENVPCPVCKQVYLRTNLRSHLLTHTGKRPYHCVICNKSFTTKWNLKLHRWTHMSRSAKPYKCNLCKGAFIRQTEYISHMNAHKSVRPYTCNYCGCQFIRKYNCQRHVREHEMAKKYVCKVPECGKSFHRSYYLSEHMKVHSGARPFSCNICGKTSSNKSNHNKHVKIHHAREPIATEA